MNKRRFSLGNKTVANMLAPVVKRMATTVSAIPVKIEKAQRGRRTEREDEKKQGKKTKGDQKERKKQEQ